MEVDGAYWVDVHEIANSLVAMAQLAVTPGI